MRRLPTSLSILLFLLHLLPSCTSKVAITGITEAGLDFGLSFFGPDENRVPGLLNQDYFAPDTFGIEHFMLQGANMFRLQFIWERVQLELMGPLDDEYLANLDSVINYVTSDLRGNSTVILSMKNYGRYYGTIIGTAQNATKEGYYNVWAKLAARYKGNRRVYFETMYSPFDISTAEWFSIQQTVINRIREAGFKGLLVLSGTCTSTGLSWQDDGCEPGIPQTSFAANTTDPLNNYAWGIKQYFSRETRIQNGSYESNCSISVPEILASVTKWMRDNHHKGFMIQFGTSAPQYCLDSITDLLTWLDKNSDVWIGWAAWAGGPAWGNYAYTLEPFPNKTERPQMERIRPFFFGTAPMFTESPTAAPIPSATGALSGAVRGHSIGWGVVLATILTLFVGLER